jgi:succinoglycan biosynthesis transport protein ExoP
MELRHYASVLWKWLWLILISTAITAGVSYYVSIQQPKVYQASTELIVGTSIQSTNPNSGDLVTSGQLAQTYVQIVTTTPVMQGTIDALGLKMSPDQLRGNVSARIIEGTQLIELRVNDIDRGRAKALADEVAHQLTLQGPAANEGQQAQQREFVQNQVNDLQQKIEGAQKTINDLEGAIKVTASARDISDKQQQIADLQTQIGQWRGNYASLVGFLTPRSPNYLSIIQPAELPGAPISPNVPLNVALAAVMGLLLSVAAAFLLEYLDDTIKSPNDVMRVLGLPMVGGIADISGSSNEKLIAATAPRSPIAEAYRVLRTNIHFSDVDHPIKSILVTSAGPMEGKSVNAANLAIVMAQAGLKTILIDCDLRRPSQHRLWGLANETGLTNSLLTQTSADGFMCSTRLENLKVYPSGALPPNPAELLASDRMRQLKARLEREADIIIIDSPPCFPIADAAILARLADGVLLVVDSGHARRDEALRAKELIQNAGGRVLGVLLNRISRASSGYAYYYHSYYSHEGTPTRERKSTITSWVAALTRR